MIRPYLSPVAVAFVALMGLPAPQAAGSIQFSGSSGSLAASAKFSISGSNLVITLTNTSTADVLVPANVLTGVYFDIVGSPTLSRVSGVLAAGSSVIYDTDGQPAGGIVGGEFAYKSGLSGAPGSAKYGISSSGLGLFGPGDLFPGTDLHPPQSPNGLEYGIVSAGDDPDTGNTGVTGSGGLIKNSVVFTLSGLPDGFLLSAIGNVRFQYGTNLSEPSFPGDLDDPTGGAGGGEVPEPMSLIVWSLLGAGAIGLVRVRRARS